MLPMSSFQSTTLVGSPDGLELAGRMLEWHLKNDNSFPQVTEQLRLAPDVYTVSGLTDVDYPTLEAGPSGQPLLKQTGIVNRIPLPPELVEHFGRKFFDFVFNILISNKLIFLFIFNRHAELLHDGTLP